MKNKEMYYRDEKRERQKMFKTDVWKWKKENVIHRGEKERKNKENVLLRRKKIKRK